MHLDISDCPNIHKFPESFVNLRKLVHLDLSNCNVEITAEAICGLTNIQHLNLSYIKSDIFKYLPPHRYHNRLESLQEVISNLIELRYLDLSGYSWRANNRPPPDEMLGLVDRICTLTNLVHLDLSRNVELGSVPERIGSLRKLSTLDLSGCEALVTLPGCMREMDSLKFLNVTGCPLVDKSTVPRSKYVVLPYFTVHADDCESSSNIGLLQHEYPNVLHISRLENVKSAKEVCSMNLSGKRAMKSLCLEWTRDAPRFVEDMDVLGELVPPKTLNYFELRGYHSVSFPTWVMLKLDDNLPYLTKVVLWGLHKCNSLPPLSKLPSLQDLILGGLDSIMTLKKDFCYPVQGVFRQLKRFYLCHMKNLEVWYTTYYCQYYGKDQPQEFMFPNLEYLLIRDCPKLRLTPCPPKTRDWEIDNSDNVLSSWNAEGEITISARQEKPGASYRATPAILKVKFSKMPLEKWRLLHHLLPTYKLSITCCAYQLITSNSSPDIIRELSSIKSLYLEDDAQLPEWLGELTSLERLGIAKYPGLDTSLENMKQLTCLRYLWLSDCGSMSALPQWLGELISLRKLTISDWRNLSDFPESLRRLTSLHELHLEGCPRVTALPEWLGDLASLNELVVNCGDMESLPASIQKLTKLERLTIYAPKLIQWCALVENKKKLAHIKLRVCYLLCIS
jgi:Leucine-rich repeat (LRR) protein